MNKLMMAVTFALIMGAPKQEEPIELTVSCETEHTSNTLYDVPFDFEEQQIMKSICDHYGMDYALILAIAKKESNFDASAIGDQGQSYGMYQIQPRYCYDIYSDEGPIDLLNKYEATVACCKVLTYLYGKFEDTVRVLNAYNTGKPDCYNGYSWDVLRIKEEIEQND
jgi:hypothetical protein